MADADTLTARETRLVAVAARAAAPDPDGLDAEVHGALTTGDLAIDELLEAVLHFAVYAGWPKASHLEMVVGVQWVEWHRERGEDPPPWPVLAADPEQTGVGRHEAGVRRFEEVNLFGAPPTDSPFRQSVVEWVFGDLWWRPELSRRDRRLVSITCVALSGRAFPLTTHVTSALHSGDIGDAAMEEVVAGIAAIVGIAATDVLVDAVAAARASRPTP